MTSELIAHSASGVMAIDSETVRARGIIGYYLLNSLLRSRSGPKSRNGTGRIMWLQPERLWKRLGRAGNQPTYGVEAYFPFVNANGPCYF